jgi:serine/threonine protein phosphatase PrpC
MKIRNIESAKVQGPRAEMQDTLAISRSLDGTYFLGVFDGHNIPDPDRKPRGAEVAEATRLVLENVEEKYGSLRSVTKKAIGVAEQLTYTHNSLPQTHSLEPGDGGTTATIAIVKKSKIAVAYLGDSEAFYYQDDGKIIPLIKPHDTTNLDEVTRVRNLGYHVDDVYFGITDKTSRLAVSRAVGDYFDFISSDADITVGRLDMPGNLVVATDGVWGDANSHEEVHALFINSAQITNFPMAHFALRLVERNAALNDDNASIIVARVE